MDGLEPAIYLYTNYTVEANESAHYTPSSVRSGDRGRLYLYCRLSGSRRGGVHCKVDSKASQFILQV